MVDIGYKTKKLKWKYARHTARQKPMRWGNKVEVWTPYESRRLRDSLLTRWRDEITRKVRHPWRTVAANWKSLGQVRRGLCLKMGIDNEENGGTFPPLRELCTVVIKIVHN